MYHLQIGRKKRVSSAKRGEERKKDATNPSVPPTATRPAIPLGIPLTDPPFTDSSRLVLESAPPLASDADRLGTEGTYGCEPETDPPGTPTAGSLFDGSDERRSVSGGGSEEIGGETMGMGSEIWEVRILPFVEPVWELVREWVGVL